MKTKTISMLAVILAIAALALLGPQPAVAQVVTISPTNSLLTISDTAASTLLGTHFMVDLNNPTGMDTLFTVNNMCDDVHLVQ